MDTPHFAHSLPGRPVIEWQPLEEHLYNVAHRAKLFATKFRSGDWAYIAGLWHDLGKCSEEFQAMLFDANLPNSKKKYQRVDHSTAGARLAAKLWPGAGKLIAYTISGHHGGLLDGKSSTHPDLAKRLDDCRMIPALQDACTEIQKANGKMVLPIQQDCNRIGFQLSFFVRMIFSCLVDADFLDTESFLSPENEINRGGRPKLKELEDLLFAKLRSFKPDSEINRKRSGILENCTSKATTRPGLFTLTVPTGGGKTLSSLAFALRHALEHDKDRVIYVIPFTSIIEQNAAVFRSILGDDAVLEHHSNFSPDIKDEESESDISITSKRHRLACENWDAPVIVTTNVQFFDSLFANRSSKCRKLHNIANSVVILDEAQMLPEPYLRPCLEAIRELATNYGCTIILCTATQPALTLTDTFPYGLAPENVTEIISDPRRLHEDFKRIQIQNAGRTTNDELLERISGHDQVLCIVNTRQRAAELFSLIHHLPGAYHLSARMCPSHRSEVLSRIRSRLADKKECRVVSTQLVEAGVDLDFPVVFREMAGLDAIAQAAGRCNRNAEMDIGNVIVFLPEDGKIPRIFRRAAGAAESVLRRFAEDPFSPDAISDYFQNVYGIAGEELDKKRILQRLREGVRNADFPFKEIAGQFRLIESDMLPIIIPWDESAETLIEKLMFTEYPGSILRQLQRYTVQIYPQEMAKLKQYGAIRMIQERYASLASLVPFYQSGNGLTVEETSLPPEDFFI